MRTFGQLTDTLTHRLAGRERKAHDPKETPAGGPDPPGAEAGLECGGGEEEEGTATALVSRDGGPDFHSPSY